MRQDATVSGIKALGTFGAIGGLCFVGVGAVIGIMLNPVYNTLETQDAKRERDQQVQAVNERNAEIETKKDLVEDFYKQYKEVK